MPIAVSVTFSIFPTPPDPSTAHLVDIFQPAEGTYQLTISGLEPGQYNLGVRAYSTDGSAQQPISVPGITGAGSTSTFSVRFASLPGAVSRLTRIASFQSTLADIANGLQIGLIDNSGIANSLSAKIQASADASARGQGTTAANILSAFENDVEAQSGTHVIGIGPQVLLEDAMSLISQIH